MPICEVQLAKVQNDWKFQLVQREYVQHWVEVPGNWSINGDGSAEVALEAGRAALNGGILVVRYKLHCYFHWPSACRIRHRCVWDWKDEDPRVQIVQLCIYLADDSASVPSCTYAGTTYPQLLEFKHEKAAAWTLELGLHLQLLEGIYLPISAEVAYRSRRQRRSWFHWRLSFVLLNKLNVDTRSHWWLIYSRAPCAVCTFMMLCCDLFWYVFPFSLVLMKSDSWRWRWERQEHLRWFATFVSATYCFATQYQLIQAIYV